MTRLVALVAVLGVAGAVWEYERRAEAERAAQRARDESFAEEDRLWDERRLARVRAENRAALAALPGRLAGALPGGPPATADALVGAWHGPHPDGGTRTVEYFADGTFRDAVAGGREWGGSWAVARVGGTRVLHVARAGGGPDVVKVSVEGDELIHDDAPGCATALRRRGG